MLQTDNVNDYIEREECGGGGTNMELGSARRREVSKWDAARQILCFWALLNGDSRPVFRLPDSWFLIRNFIRGNVAFTA